VGERSNKLQTVFVSLTEALAQIINNSTCDVINCHIVNEDDVVVKYKNCETFEQESLTTNIAPSI
jgi:hypothetical protein